VSARYELIDAQKASYPVVKMCSWLGVSRSGFYEWASRPESATARRRAELCLLIQKAFDDSDGTYGHRRVHAQLARWGVRASLELVRALMRSMDLQPCQPRPWRPTTTVAGDAAATPDPGLRHCLWTRYATRRRARAGCRLTRREAAAMLAAPASR
jgi:hypothetical protein